jgi:hypothetical protein
MKISATSPVVNKFLESVEAPSIPNDEGLRDHFRTALERKSICGPRELFDARYITMPDCCLLDMKHCPDHWPMPPSLIAKLIQDAMVAQAWIDKFVSQGVELHRGIHLAMDVRLHLQVLIGAVPMIQGKPLPMIFRYRSDSTPTKADVVTAVCAAFLGGYTDSLLVYQQESVQVFGIGRNRKIFDQVSEKSLRLANDLRSAARRECKHAITGGNGENSHSHSHDRT